MSAFFGAYSNWPIHLKMCAGLIRDRLEDCWISACHPFSSKDVKITNYDLLFVKNALLDEWIVKEFCKRRDIVVYTEHGCQPYLHEYVFAMRVYIRYKIECERFICGLYDVFEFFLAFTDVVHDFEELKLKERDRLQLDRV